MRDHDHLMGARQVCEHLREGAGRGAADASVDLVEHECVDGVRLAEDHLGSEHHARELAAAGDTAQRTRRHAGTAAVQQLASGWALDGPALTCERLAVPHELGAAHLETRHLLAHLAAKARRRSVPALGQRPGGLGKLGLGGIAGIAGAPHAGLGVIDKREQLGRLIAAGEDVLHMRAPLAQQALERRVALLRGGQLRRVKIDRITVSAQLSSRIFDRDGSAGKLVGKLGELDVDAGHAGQLRDGRIECIERTALAGQGLSSIVGATSEALRVLDAGQALLELLEFAGLGIDIGYALEGKPRLLKTASLGAARLLDALELARGLVGTRKRVAVRGECLGNTSTGPGIDHPNMGSWVEQPLVLVLTAQVDQGAHALGQFAHARKRSVHTHAGTAVGAQATLDNEALLVASAAEQTSLDKRTVAPLANRRGIRTLAHQQLEGGKQGGLARARLAGEDRETGTGHQVGAFNQRDVLDMDLIDHCAPRKRRGSRTCKSSPGRNRAAGCRHRRDARRRARPHQTA